MTDVIIITDGLNAGEIEPLQSFFARHGITLLDCGRELSSKLSEFRFNDTHVTPTSLGRLMMSDLLPEHYRHILYIDGDTFVVGDLTELFRLRVPSGRIAASLESLFVHWDSDSDFAKKLRTYRRRHSRLGPTDYFNAGILAADRSTWQSIGPEALKFYSDHQEDCIYHDQSALNVICENRVQWISPAYNFLSDFRLMGFEAHIQPKLYHFSGAAKPWNSRISPWPINIYGRYKKFARDNQQLRSFSKINSTEQNRRIRNRLFMHAITEAPGIMHPQKFIMKHKYFRNYLEERHFIGSSSYAAYEQQRSKI